MSENYPGRPLTRREIRERELAAAAAAGAAGAQPAAPSPAQPALATPAPSRRSMHAAPPQPAVGAQVRPPATTGGMRALDETGRLTPVQRPTGGPVPVAPASPAAAPTRTSSRMPAPGTTPPQQAAFPRRAAAPESAPRFGGPAVPSFGQPPTSAAPPAQAAQAPSSPFEPSTRSSRFATPPAEPASPFGQQARPEPTPAPFGQTSAAPERPTLGSPFGTVSAPSAATPSSAGLAPAPAPAPSPWGGSAGAEAAPAATPAAPAWGSITGPGAATAGDGPVRPGSLPPSRPQPSPFDSFVAADQPVHARAAAAQQEDEDEYRPSSYTWLHYIILVVVAFVLGLLLWRFVAGDGPSFATDAAPAGVVVTDLLTHSRGIL